MDPTPTQRVETVLQLTQLDIDENENISFCFKSCNYDIEAELKTNKTNFELDNYKIELTKGRYRDMSRVNKSFEAQGYDTSKF